MELIDDMQQQQRRPVDNYSEGDEFEEEEGAGAGAKYALGPTPAAWVAGARKRSVDELEPDADVRGDVHASASGGTPPKRAWTGERELPTVQLLKRRSEELEILRGVVWIGRISASGANTVHVLRFRSWFFASRCGDESKGRSPPISGDDATILPTNLICMQVAEPAIYPILSRSIPIDLTNDTVICWRVEIANGPTGIAVINACIVQLRLVLIHLKPACHGLQLWHLNTLSTSLEFNDVSTTISTSGRSELLVKVGRSFESLRVKVVDGRVRCSESRSTQHLQARTL
ncbi:hypothetical protein C8R44DRAFT_116873 [Mycena epipterygia]|nr:hypothetical protein C8R44DRAFT_116873 [Mycena epipterygia]